MELPPIMSPLPRRIVGLESLQWVRSGHEAPETKRSVPSCCVTTKGERDLKMSLVEKEDCLFRYFNWHFYAELSPPNSHD